MVKCGSNPPEVGHLRAMHTDYIAFSQHSNLQAVSIVNDLMYSLKNATTGPNRTTIESGPVFPDHFSFFLKLVR